MAADISIVICTFNRYEVLTAAIAAVEQQDMDPERFELIIVDNSDDITMREKYREGLDIICRHRYLVEDMPGLSRARNIGVRAAEGAIVAFMDDDAQPSTRWAAALLDAFAADPMAAVVGGPVRPIWRSARPVWLHEWLEGFLTIVDRGPVRRELTGEEWLAGTNIAFRKSVLLKAGLFDENLGRIGRLLLSNEEIKISHRIRAMGYKTVYTPEADMLHHVHAERMTPAWLRRRVVWQTLSDLLVSGGDTARDFDEDVGVILSFLAELPARHRGVAGLFVDLDDPALFHEQTRALSALIRIAATDGRSFTSFLRSEPSA
jgi:glycosyltransferase involved in cell wall biosynthesis